MERPLFDGIEQIGLFQPWLQVIVLVSACVAFLAMVVVPLYWAIRYELHGAYGGLNNCRSQRSNSPRPVQTGQSTPETASSTIGLFDRASLLFAKIAALFVLSLLISQFSVVLLRYLFSVGSIALQESVLYFHAMIFMFGASLGFIKNTHVRLDLIYGKLQTRGKALVNLLGSILLLLPFAGTLSVTGYFYVERAWATREASIEVSGLQYVYLLKTVILVFAMLLLLQAINRILDAVATRTARKANARHEHA